MTGQLRSRGGRTVDDFARYRDRMAKTGKNHLVRNVLIVAAAAGIAVALRNAVADKGGSYDPADAGLSR